MKTPSTILALKTQRRACDTKYPQHVQPYHVRVRQEKQSVSVAERLLLSWLRSVYPYSGGMTSALHCLAAVQLKGVCRGGLHQFRTFRTTEDGATCQSRDTPEILSWYRLQVDIVESKYGVGGGRLKD